MLKNKYGITTENKRKGSKRNTRLCLLLTGGVMAGMLGGTLGAYGQSGGVLAANSSVSQTTANSEVKLLSNKKSSDTESKENLKVTDIVEAAMPSVVSITTKTVQEIQNYFDMYSFGQGSSAQQEIEGSGSGIIIGKNDSELLLVTNYHVIEDADTVSVTFSDDSSYEAKIKGTDSDSDLAVVAVSLDDISDDTLDTISIAVMGNSDEVEVGEQVVAIGNALGYGQSVTTGIVSAKNRTLSQDDDGVKLIQTDAAINPGNSGGPLLNMKGEVIGINSVKMASSGIEGMGYAISITNVEDKLNDLMNTITRDKAGKGDQASLGIKGVTVDESAVQLYGIAEGVYVSEVTEGSAADNAGIKAGDVITEFDGKEVSTIQKLKSVIEYYTAGESVEVTIERQDNGEYAEKTVTVVLDKNDLMT